MSPAGKPHGPLVALSTASVFPDRTPDAFEVAARLGYDGIEVMVSADAVSQDVDVIRRLVDYHGIPVLAVHSPCLLVTQRVWGREPWGKLTKSAAVAETLGARVVVVHPPFRWQRDYAREFAAGLERMRDETDVIFAVENMYPLRAGGAEVAPYSPHWNPVQQDYPAVTLDLSHTSVSGSDAMAMAADLGSRLAHVHMADGTGLTNRDEHLVPGRGVQPCAPLLEKLAAEGYTGAVVLEVNTRRASSRDARRADLAEALEFTRRHLAAGAAGPDGRGGGRRGAGTGGDAPAPAGATTLTSGGARRQARSRAGGGESAPPAGGDAPGPRAGGGTRERAHGEEPGPQANGGQPAREDTGDQDGRWPASARDGGGPAARRMAGRVRNLGRVAIGRTAGRETPAGEPAGQRIGGPVAGAEQGALGQGASLAVRRWSRLDERAGSGASCRS